MCVLVCEKNRNGQTEKDRLSECQYLQWHSKELWNLKFWHVFKSESTKKMETNSWPAAPSPMDTKHFQIPFHVLYISHKPKTACAPGYLLDKFWQFSQTTIPTCPWIWWQKHLFRLDWIHCHLLDKLYLLYTYVMNMYFNLFTSYCICKSLHRLTLSA